MLLPSRLISALISCSSRLVLAVSLANEDTSFSSDTAALLTLVWLTALVEQAVGVNARADDQSCEYFFHFSILRFVLCWDSIMF